MSWLILAVAESFVLASLAYQYALYTLITSPGALRAGGRLASDNNVTDA